MKLLQVALQNYSYYSAQFSAFAKIKRAIKSNMMSNISQRYTQLHSGYFLIHLFVLFLINLSNHFNIWILFVFPEKLGF